MWCDSRQWPGERIAAVEYNLNYCIDFRSTRQIYATFVPERFMECKKNTKLKKLNSVVLVRKRTIPTKRPQPADEVSANFS
jgi:hypothetical protein